MLTTTRSENSVSSQLFKQVLSSTQQDKPVTANDNINSRLLSLLPTDRYSLAAPYYTLWLKSQQYNHSDSVDSIDGGGGSEELSVITDTELFSQCLLLANYLEDTDFWHYVTKQLLDNWNEFAMAVLITVNDDVHRQVYLLVPHNFLPDRYRHDPAFMTNWLAHKQSHTDQTCSCKLPVISNCNIKHHEVCWTVTPKHRGLDAKLCCSISINKVSYQTDVNIWPEGCQIITYIVNDYVGAELSNTLADYQDSCQLQQLSCPDFKTIIYMHNAVNYRHSFYFDVRHYSNKQVKSEGYYVDYEEYIEPEDSGDDDKETEESFKYLGTHRSWYENGIMREEASYSNDFYIDESCHYREYAYNGLHRYWFSNGQLRTSIGHLDGKRHGDCQEFFENAQSKLLAHYQNGKLVGDYRQWSLESAIPIISGHYDHNGNKVGYWVVTEREKKITAH